MMDLVFLKMNMRTYLSHFIKLIKEEQTQNQVLAWFINCIRYIRSHGGNIKLEKSNEWS